jgi:hypothetical protein
MFFRFSRRYNARYILCTFFFFSIHYKEEFPDFADSLPTILPGCIVCASIGPPYPQRIGKHILRHFKVNSMLPHVLIVLGFIPDDPPLFHTIM